MIVEIITKKYMIISLIFAGKLVQLPHPIELTLCLAAWLPASRSPPFFKAVIVISLVCVGGTGSVSGRPVGNTAPVAPAAPVAGTMEISLSVTPPGTTAIPAFEPQDHN